MNRLVSISEKTFANRKKLLASLNIFGLVGVFIFLVWNYYAGGIMYVVSQGEAGLIMEYFGGFSFLKTSLIVVSLVLVEVIVGIIPAVAMYPIIGLMTGSVWGIILISIGNILGNSLNYWQGKFIAGAFIKNEKYLNLLEKMKGGGFKELFLLRVNPVTSFDSVSYLAGALGMKFWKFIAATVIGVTPWIVIGVTIGGDILEKYDFALSLLLVLVGVCMTYLIVKKIILAYKRS